MKKVFSVVRKGWLAGILCLILTLSVVGSVRADDGKTYTIMHPDQETLLKWIESYNAAPRAYIDLEKYQVPSPQGSLSLLSHLQYTPVDRNQGNCGNCWAWAGTGCLGIALHVEETILARLSMQYINSCGTNVDGEYCCCGGFLDDLADFYTTTKRAIPWSNANASWQDSAKNCAAGSSDVSCASIVKTPHYPITSINDEMITTQTVSQAAAISNIKNILNQNKAVYFSFLLPTDDSWNGADGFFPFWTNQDEEDDIYDIDQFNGTPYVQNGGAHAVLCVGYNDEASPPYWVMLNSWGTTANRPNGLFRITMDMDYDCVNFPYYAFYWQSLDVDFSTTITFAASPADSGWITFDGAGYEDGDTDNIAADIDYAIIAHPEPGYVFSKWQTTGGLDVDDPDSATTTCDVTGSGTLTTVQTATTFTDSDFSGIWNLYVVSQDAGSANNGWTYGPVESNGDGTIAAGAVDALTREDGTNATVLDTSTYTLNANGTLEATINLTTPEGPATVNIKGAMNSRKDVIGQVSTMPDSSPDAYQTGTLIKEGSGFLLGDFSGTWSLYASWQDAGAVDNGWVMGSVISNGAGGITGGTLTFEDGHTENITGNNYTVAVDGKMTINLVVDGDNYAIQGAMNNSKDVIGQIFTNVTPTPDVYGGGALVKNQAADFEPEDFKGTWRFYEVWQVAASVVNGWCYGTLISDGVDQITSGTYVDDDGETGSIDPESYALDANGVLTIPLGAVPGTGEGHFGAMNDGLDVIAFVRTITESPAEYGAGVMVYPSSSSAAAAAKDDGGGGVCAIATASYGTPMAEEVKALSAFRDQYLLTNKPGRTLVSAYERISPPVADFIRDKEALKAIIRAGLKPLLEVADQLTSK